jgi:hypothetical protein
MNTDNIMTDSDLHLEDRPVDVHRKLHDDIRKCFTLIFSSRDHEVWFNRLNNLRLDSSVWVDRDWTKGERSDFVATSVEAELQRLFDLANEVQRFVFKGRVVCGDRFIHDFYAKKFHDMKMILFRNEKRRRKVERPIPVSLFTPGSVVEFVVGAHLNPVPRVYTVAHVSDIALGRAIVTSQETHMETPTCIWPFPTSDVSRISTVWATRVIKHVPGDLKVKHYYDWSWESFPRAGKSKNSYCVDYGVRELFMAEISRLGLEHLHIEVSEMVAAYLAYAPGCRRVYEADAYPQNVLLIRKQKFRRWFRQNINRFLVSRSKQEQANRDYERQQEAEYARDMEWERDNEDRAEEPEDHIEEREDE